MRSYDFTAFNLLSKPKGLIQLNLRGLLGSAESGRAQVCNIDNKNILPTKQL